MSQTSLRVDESALFPDEVRRAAARLRPGGGHGQLECRYDQVDARCRRGAGRSAWLSGAARPRRTSGRRTAAAAGVSRARGGDPRKPRGGNFHVEETNK